MTCRFLLAALAMAVLPGARAQEIPGATPELNRSFQEPDVGQYVERFESESREVFTRRREVVAALGLRPGMDVADIGAGTGLYAIPIAEAVGPEGAVFAVDIAPNFLRHIAERSSKAGLLNVCTVLGTQDSPQLPPGSVDLAFICDTYHHFEDPAAMLGAIRRALRPGGRLVVIEFDRREGVSSEFILEHVRADASTFIEEISDSGFSVIELDGVPRPELEENFFAMFVRTPEPGDPPLELLPEPGERDRPVPPRPGADR
ncbi:class I SAM-dependent methyltransferase [Tautonia plasticadhaerens]|uniref:Demethylmenaquinone methyltransferase n=1 Tax=Tautonia plasticadhaerens TaxID=2527974 RepID=A0A518GX44_9BACT|nr:methyltransferase domain-containing protein [Tautonia plasticadhaerens]QDV33143.1 Demethylmenaquinone methyltransferase [Tautonia plasticadhaerens]